jgi:hypothetical protein
MEADMTSHVYGGRTRSLRTVRRFAGIAGVLAVATGTASELSAQEVPRPAPESRARFTAIDQETGRLRTTVGTVASASSDSLVVRSDRRGAVVAAAWHDVTRLEEGAGMWSREHTVAVAALVFGASGAAMGSLMGEDCANVPRDSLCLFPRQEFAVAMGVLGTATGIVAGLIAPRRERWSPRAVPAGLRLDVGAGGRPGIGASLAF